MTSLIHGVNLSRRACRPRWPALVLLALAVVGGAGASPVEALPVTDKVDALLGKVEQDRRISSYDKAEELGIDHKTVLTLLKKAGCTKKLNT
ncbi:hypothetical protein EVAR_33647_1 [Eumeta japonica]|uniref:Uncharacterized protein n=1 Tax=Eumeta variegata TaxID=151549 RepID=A0A4C1VQG4_EUMVA|nr:hypothetical protein EVAR_33647_1 [Eumeta japonica]